MSTSFRTTLMLAVPACLMIAAVVLWAVIRASHSGDSNDEAAVPADSGSDNTAAHTVGEEGDMPAYTLVDPQASPATRSLFAYLQEIRGRHILFGHQHATTEFIAVTGNPIQSDVYNAAGDFPAIFGWDTLSIEGKEKPGINGDIEASRERLIEKMREAHRLGGIIALSTHFPNFVTGGSFYDTSVGAVEHILPGGSKHAEFNEMLDHVAYVANNLKDDNGELIPILFRPFHEQNGSWFWWGARLTKTSDYIALYRYTVEYLRDHAGVRNFLYVYSPNGPFAGDEAAYLTTYPGDQYVDILGMDQYDNQDRPGTRGFLNGLARDLAMINRLADAKGKVAALSEFGYSPQGMKTTGNGDLQWFTKVLAAIKSDPDARRTAYMQTWANFSTDGNLFVPYKDAALLGDHELLPDFIAFYKDEYTAFAGDLTGVYDRPAAAAAKEPFIHIASPTAGTTAVDSVTVRVRVLHADPAEVTFAVRGAAEPVPMVQDAAGYYAAEWRPDAALIGSDAVIVAEAVLADGTLLKDSVGIRIGSGEPPAAELLYPFESSEDGWTINNDNGGAWNTAQATGPVLSQDAASSGATSLRADFQLGGGSFELTRVGNADFSGVLALEAKALVRFGEGADAGGGVRAKLYIKTGESWAWTDSGETMLDSSGFATIHFDLSNVSGLDAVRSIGMQIVTDTGSSGTASVYLDDVTVYRPAELQTD